MSEKKVLKIDDEALQSVSGGTQELPLEICPVCKEKCMRHSEDIIDGTLREISQCQYCHRAFYINDAGELITLDKWC